MNPTNPANSHLEQEKIAVISEKNNQPNITADDVEHLRSAILEHRPVLKHILQERGNESLFQYISSYTTSPHPIRKNPRSEELLAAFEAEVSVHVDPRTAKSAVKQLKKYYYVSTTDHYGPLYHPWVLNFNLITGAAYEEHPDPDLRHIITLACSNVSLNNFSFPRGVAFTSLVNEQSEWNRLSLLPSNAHSYPVYGFAAYTKSAIEKIKNIVNELKNKHNISDQIYTKLLSIIDTIFGAEYVLTAKNYADQVTRINQLIWKQLFPPQKKDIDFIYVEQEWIVVRLLADYHLGKSTVLDRLLFDPQVMEKFLKHFSGVPEAFDIERKIGTYLFWYVIPECKKHRLRLWPVGNELITDDGKYRVALTPESIREKILSGELMPSVLLTFITLFCHYGLTCLGGMGQINYLPKIQSAYVALLKELGDKDGVRIAEKPHPSHLGGEVTAAFLGGPNGLFAPATAIDLLLYGEPNVASCVVNAAKQLTLEEAIDPMLPEDYPMHYKKADMDPKLAAIRQRDIPPATGLNEHMKPCAYIV